MFNLIKIEHILHCLVLISGVISGSAELKLEILFDEFLDFKCLETKEEVLKLNWKWVLYEMLSMYFMLNQVA